MTHQCRREVLQGYRDSKHPKVSAAGIEIRTGRKWSAIRGLEKAEARLRHKVVLGTVVKGRAGFPSPKYNKAQGQGEKVACLGGSESSCGRNKFKPPEKAGGLDEMGECDRTKVYRHLASRAPAHTIPDPSRVGYPSQPGKPPTLGQGSCPL